MGTSGLVGFFGWPNVLRVKTIFTKNIFVLSNRQIINVHVVSFKIDINLLILS